jgi:hypothetical protein
MKKQVLVVIAGIAFIGAAVFTVVSCSKSEQPDVIKEGKDATDIIDRIINCAQVMADYWTDVVVYQFLYDEYCNDEPVFWSGNYDDCLSPEEITHWSNMANCLIGDLKPQGKSRIIADIEWDFLLSVSWVHYMHYLSYGVPHSSGGGTK